jgi:hypothetical protein
MLLTVENLANTPNGMGTSRILGNLGKPGGDGGIVPHCVFPHIRNVA